MKIKKNIYKFRGILFLLYGVLLNFYMVSTVNAGTVKLYNPLKSDLTPSVFIGKVIGAFINIVGALALLMFIYGGFVWMTSRGDSKQVESGKNTVLWTSLGLVLIFTARTIINYLFDKLT